MKRFIALATVCMMSVGVVAGCGSNTNEATDGDASVTKTVESDIEEATKDATEVVENATSGETTDTETTEGETVDSEEVDATTGVASTEATGTEDGTEDGEVKNSETVPEATEDSDGTVQEKVDTQAMTDAEVTDVESNSIMVKVAE